jgi:hypothetical protein
VIGRTRPLICRTLDGRRYVVPTIAIRPAQEPTPQAPSDTASAPKADRRPTLTEDDVREIRADYAEGRWSQGDLAYIHGVTQNPIGRIVRGLTTGIKTQASQQES